MGIVARILTCIDDCIGDQYLVDRLWQFASADVPALELANGVALASLTTSGAFYQSKVRLTAFGSQLLNGADRWIGGVHLSGRTVPWRYDAIAKRLISR